MPICVQSVSFLFPFLCTFFIIPILITSVLEDIMKHYGLGFQRISHWDLPWEIMSYSWYAYCISLIRHCGYFFVSLHISVQLLFVCGVHFFRKPTKTNNSMFKWYSDDFRRCQYSKSSLSVLLWAMEMSRTTWTALVLAHWPLSEIICIRVCVCHV